MAEDVVADVFCVAFEQRDRYDAGRVNALPWLYGIATNLVRRRWRQEVARYRAMAKVVPPLAGGDEPAQRAVERTDAAEYVRLITSALERMPSASTSRTANRLSGTPLCSGHGVPGSSNAGPPHLPRPAAGRPGCTGRSPKPGSARAATWVPTSSPKCSTHSSRTLAQASAKLTGAPSGGSGSGSRRPGRTGPARGRPPRRR
ncbi:RNA polymerase sigma factor [Amycolatopsis sp. NPDC003861]